MWSLSGQFELARDGDSPNLRSMEGMRGFAVFLVFLAHFVSLIGPWVSKNTALEAVAEALHAIGNVGVDLFFVLSGYLIYRSIIGRSQNFLRFFRRRVTRIYPAFLVVFCIYLIISFARPAESKIVGTGWEAWIYILENLLLLPGLFPIIPIITVAWSLSYEMMYYIAIPVVIALFGMRERSARWRVLFFLMIALLIAAYSALAGGPVRLIMFVSGILLHEAMRNRTVGSADSPLALFALIAGLAASAVPTIGSASYSLKVIILFVSFFIFCYSCFSRPGEWLARLFCFTPMRWLGNMSYSYYLLHGLTLKIAFLVLAAKVPAVQHETAFFVLLLPIMFAVSLLPATGLFLLIERPLSLSTAGEKGGVKRAAGVVN